MRVYHLPDIDGLLEGVVAASNLDEAATALGLTPRQMRECGWALFRSLHGSGARWESDRSKALVTASKAAMRAEG